MCFFNTVDSDDKIKRIKGVPKRLKSFSNCFNRILTYYPTKFLKNSFPQIFKVINEMSTAVLIYI